MTAGSKKLVAGPLLILLKGVTDMDFSKVGEWVLYLLYHVTLRYIMLKLLTKINTPKCVLIPDSYEIAQLTRPASLYSLLKKNLPICHLSIAQPPLPKSMSTKSHFNNRKTLLRCH